MAFSGSLYNRVRKRWTSSQVQPANCFHQVLLEPRLLTHGTFRAAFTPAQLLPRRLPGQKKPKILTISPSTEKGCQPLVIVMEYRTLAREWPKMKLKPVTGVRILDALLRSLSLFLQAMGIHLQSLRYQTHLSVSITQSPSKSSPVPTSVALT